jgi:hypothetical protein
MELTGGHMSRLNDGVHAKARENGAVGRDISPAATTCLNAIYNVMLLN